MYVERARQAWGAVYSTAYPVRGTLRDTATRSDTLLAADPRRIALSPAELGWLQKHHYPTDAELATLAAVDPTPADTSLDPGQATLLGLALLRRGDTGAGIVVLRRAAARGSIYAYEEAAIAEYRQRRMQSGPSDDGDDVLGAHLEVAQILGDHQAEYLTGTYLPGYRRRDPARALALQRYTSEFLLRLGAEAKSLGAAPPGPDPRPGLPQWQDLRRLAAAGESATVDVYAAQ
ncbi:MAG TPA: hypothetical protein VM687_11875 [Stenotrophomonas sp.]|nr:hypothetical protein [Stenotrophomonas sp.]